MYTFSDLEPVCCSMSGSNCCFLTCIQVSQEAGKVIEYSHLLKNFPQFVVIYVVKGFSVVNGAEVEVFMEVPCFLHNLMTLVNSIYGSSGPLNFFLWRRFHMSYLAGYEVNKDPILYLRVLTV